MRFARLPIWFNARPAPCDVLVGNGLANTLIGGGGNDLIMGMAGADHLYGDAGRDLLVGGLGADHVNGGSGDDLLIGGTTKYDKSPNRLDTVLAEWSRDDLKVTERRQRVMTGGDLNGKHVLNSETVLDDLSIDQTFGDSGNDLGFNGATDFVADSVEFVEGGATKLMLIKG